MATLPASLPLALVDEKGENRWLFSIHTNRRLKVIKNPGKAAADDMYATSYTVQGMDGGWDALGNPFVFVLAENGMIYHIHHQPPHWQHRAVTRLPLSRTCTNFQSALLGKAHVLLIQHIAPGEWGGAASHYRVMGRDILPIDATALPRNARHLYVQAGEHIACLTIDQAGKLGYAELAADMRQWNATTALPYTLPSPEATPAVIGLADGIQVFWPGAGEPGTGYYAMIPQKGDIPDAPQAFPLPNAIKDAELGWACRPEGPLPLWQDARGVSGRDPRRPQGEFRYQAAGGKVTPIRVVRADARHHRIAHRAFAVLSGFTIVTQPSKEEKNMENAAEEERLQRLEQRQKRLAAQMKDMYISLTQMQDEMMRQSRALFQLESVLGTRTKTVKEYSQPQEEVLPEESRPPSTQKRLQIKDIQ